MIWMNVDKPTKKCTIHTDPGCQYVLNKRETPLKGVEELKSDGGWLSFASQGDADEYRAAHFSGYAVSTCC